MNVNSCLDTILFLVSICDVQQSLKRGGDWWLEMVREWMDGLRGRREDGEWWVGDFVGLDWIGWGGISVIEFCDVCDLRS
jgi:hypothetical protein